MSASMMGGGSQGLSSLAAALSPGASAGQAPPPAVPVGPPGGHIGIGMQSGADQQPQGDPSFPSTQAEAINHALALILQMQQQDQGNLVQAQQSALQQSPLFQALISGAPVGPGHGQDGQAIGPSGLTMPHSGYAA